MTYIYERVEAHDFAQAFIRMGRTDQFSREGLAALFEYLEGLAEDTGSPIELDVIALCCEFYEGTAEDVARDYRVTVGEGEDLKEAVREYLDEHTFVAAEYIVRDRAGTEKTCFLYQAF